MQSVEGIMNSNTVTRRPQVPFDQVSADDVRQMWKRINWKKEPVPVAKFGSAI